MRRQYRSQQPIVGPAVGIARRPRGGGGGIEGPTRGSNAGLMSSDWQHHKVTHNAQELRCSPARVAPVLPPQPAARHQTSLGIPPGAPGRGGGGGGMLG